MKQLMLNNNTIYTEPMTRGMICFNILSFEDAVKLSNYISIIENITGERVADYKDIMKKRGL